MKKVLYGLVAAGLVLLLVLGGRGYLGGASVPVAPGPGTVTGAEEPVAPGQREPGGAVAEPAEDVHDGSGGPDARAEPVEAGAGPSADKAAAAAAPAPTPAEQGSRPRGGASPQSPASGDAGGSPAPVQTDAESILRRASAAYEAVRSLSADFVMRLENPLLRQTTTSRGTLYQRHPDRLLLRFEEPQGDLIVSDGSYLWVYYPSVDPRQVIRTTPAGGAGGIDLRAQFVGDPVTRFEATLEGREEVGGRTAHVLTLVLRERIGYRSLKVWIDAQDHLVRRFEIAEDNGSVRRFELSGMRTNPQLGDDLFRFTPPDGARIVDRV